MGDTHAFQDSRNPRVRGCERCGRPKDHEIHTVELKPAEREAIHAWFGLTYSNYLVLPRSVLQSMPDEWQHRFVGTLEELRDAFGHLDWPEYHVLTLQREAEMITPMVDCEECDGDGVTGDEDCSYCETLGTVEDPAGERYETLEEVGTRTDPIPHYNRGRTRLEPQASR